MGGYCKILSVAMAQGIIGIKVDFSIPHEVTSLRFSIFICEINESY